MKIHQIILAAIVGISSGIIAIMLLKPESREQQEGVFCDENVWRIVNSITESSNNPQQEAKISRQN